MRARWKRSLRIRSSWIGVWRHIKPFMPLFQLIERYPLGIECASKKCVALYDGLIFFFHNGSLSSYWVKTDGSWDCARYMLKGTVWSPCWMRKNVSDATVCPYISLQCGIGRFCASGKWSALGRYWYGTERKRFLACGCGRGRMGTGADPFWMIDHFKNRPAEW